MFDHGYRLRLGAMAPDFLKGLKTVAARVHYLLSNNLDLDSAFGIKNKLVMVKLGLGHE